MNPQSFGILRLSTSRLDNINTIFFIEILFYTAPLFIFLVYLFIGFILLFLYNNDQFSFTFLKFPISSLVWIYLKINVGYFASLVKAFKLCQILTLPVPCISESCIKMKINVNFYFHTSSWRLKRFYEGLRGLRKTFWGTAKKCENKNLI